MSVVDNAYCAFERHEQECVEKWLRKHEEYDETITVVTISSEDSRPLYANAPAQTKANGEHASPAP